MQCSSETFCFPAAQRAPKRGSLLFRGPKALRIEIRGWSSHKVMSRAAEILLREQLGMDVEVIKFGTNATSLGPPYARLASGDVDLNFGMG